MKSLIKCPHSGNFSSKRVISLLFAIVAVIGAFIPYVDNTVVITFASLAVGSNALTKNLNIGKTNIE